METLQVAAQLRVEGSSYEKIANQLGVSTMAVWRALNGRTKGLVQGASNGQ
jgi:predicted transcriptional regulator